MEKKKQVIVVSLPGESDGQYYEYLRDIVKFFIEMDEKTNGRDHLFIIHDKSGRWYLNRHEFKNAHLIEVDQYLDLWMRDSPPTMPKLQIKFKYRPGYIKSSEAKRVTQAFEKFATQVGLPSLEHCNLVLEGGNIVENGVDCAVVTDRVFKENKGKSEDNVVKALESAIKRKVVFTPDPEDSTGHSDGTVSFVEKDVLLIASYPDPDGQEYLHEVENEVKKECPSIQAIPLPCYMVNKKYRGFTSAEGSYANSLVTYNAVYLPFFSNQTSNQKAFDVFKSSTDKEVVPVHSAGKLAVLGGSIRCLTWQIDQDHPVAQSLFRYIEGSGDDGQDNDDGSENEN
ncbi:uncharacterized protein LOC116297126 isoform X2 [Actinia tenebrosa]|nr:uncharacterized protein LOC116297126 isoform X2 [Actinia tenebrosa]